MRVRGARTSTGGLRRGWLAVLVWGPAFGSLGCGKLLGIDEYAVGLPSTPACGEGAVRVNGECVTVGVPSSECAATKFVSDEHQGCDPILPPAPCPGELAQPGNGKCVEPYSCTSSGYQRPFLSGGNWYVRADAALGGNGTVDAPFQKISDALEATESEVDPNILVASGEYHENLIITHKLSIQGNCPLDAGTRLSPSSPAEPAVTFTVDAGGAELDFVKIVDGTTGIFVDGAATVFLNNDVITFPNGPGIRLDDRKSDAASVTIGGTVIEGALGAGVIAHGGRIEINGGTIRDTRDPGPGKDACGVCIRSSGVVPLLPPDTGGAVFWDPRQSAQPSLIISGTLIENNAGAGVSVIGASATISQSVVRSTGSATAAGRVGIDVSERSFGQVPASLELVQSLVEGVTATGVRGHDATITIDRSVIRDVGGASDGGNKRCLGNGVRARWDHDPDPALFGSPTLVVESSLVERTHEAGIFVEGGSASIKRTVVRDTAADPCAGGLGDGIVVHALPNITDLARSSLTVEESRIDGSARSAVAAFQGASVDLKASALLGGSALHALPDSSLTLAEAFCGESGAVTWQACAPTHAALEPALLGGAGCVADDDTFCAAYCGVNSAIATTPVGVPGLRWWSLDHDEVAPMVTDEHGCLYLEGLPRNREVLLGTASRVPPANVAFTNESYSFAYVAGQALNTIFGNEDVREPPTLPLYEGYATLGFFIGLLHGTATNIGPVPDFDVDMTTSPNLGVWICGAHPEQAPEGTDVCRDPGRAVTDVVVSLDPPIDPTLGPYYADGTVPVVGDAYTHESSLGALAVFLNVPPGERRVVLKAADIPENSGKTLDCTIDAGKGLGSGAWTEERTPNVFRQVLVPGFATGFWAYCSLD